MRVWWLLSGVLLMAVATARADILVWRDANGVRHFTNRAEDVPADHRVGVQVLIAYAPRVEASVDPATAPPAPAAAVAADRAPLDDAYRTGLAEGLMLAGGGGGGGGAAAGGSVEIVGPLAVANVHAPEVSWEPYGWGGGWPGYYPFVTTGFDRGRSRHQTLRMLLQDQFQLDRDGPYAYGRWGAPGLGPALAPFLPRGLPVSVRQYGRVLYR